MMSQHLNASYTGDAAHQRLRTGRYVAKLAPGEEPAAIPLQPGNDIPQTEAQLIIKARNRWLKGQELHSLLQLCKDGMFPYSMTAATRPPGGTMFLYDRKVVRFFRLDGHNWRKKNDNKTVRETHEKLKLENVDAINCYYAHALEPATLQRRCYWLLDNDNYVLVHYLQTVPQDDSAKQGQAWQDQLIQQQQQYMSVNQSLNMGLGVPLSLAPFNVMQHAAQGTAQSQQSMMGLGDLQQMSLMTEQMMRDHKRHAAIHAAIHQRNAPDSMASTIWGQGGGFQMNHLPWEGPTDTPSGPPTSVGNQAAVPQWDALALNSLTGPGSHPNRWDFHDPNYHMKMESKGGGVTSTGLPMPMLTACHGRNSPNFQPQKVSRTSFEAPPTSRPPVEASIGAPWFNLWELTPEVVSPDGGTKVIIVGSPSPGFELSGELYADVGGQKIRVDVLQAGMLSFEAPQRSPGHIQVTLTDSSGRALSSSAILKFQYPRRASCSDAVRPRFDSGRMSSVRASALPEHSELDERNSLQQLDLIRNFLSTKSDAGMIGLGKRHSEAGAAFDNHMSGQ